jgi:hypothetical protein
MIRRLHLPRPSVMGADRASSGTTDTPPPLVGYLEPYSDLR